MSVASDDLCRRGSSDCPARSVIMPRQKSEHVRKAHGLHFRKEKEKKKKKAPDAYQRSAASSAQAPVPRLTCSYPARQSQPN